MTKAKTVQSILKVRASKSLQKEIDEELKRAIAQEEEDNNNDKTDKTDRLTKLIRGNAEKHNDNIKETGP